MARLILVVVLQLSIFVSTALAQEVPRARPGVPPRFVTVLQINQRQGEIDLANVTVRFVPETRVRAVKQDGKVENVTETVMKPVYEERMVGRVALVSAEVFEAGGKKLSREDVLKRVAVGTIVVISADGKPVNPAYLRLLANETLVIDSPQIAMQGAVAGDGGAFTPREP
jgi:hypothetical protein